ncbi:MAG: ECF transporter S component [Promethearchaeota archaeon]
MAEKQLAEEKKYQQDKKNFMGYLLPTDPLTISIVGIFAALICVLTLIIRVPVPATGGYINIGDIGVMITAILFGPIIGCLAGGIGSALADLIGYPVYTIPTLIIKGLEGFVIGMIANPKKEHSNIYRDVIAVLIGGSIMVLGYFIFQAFIFNLGIPSALVELPGNLIQFTVGAIAAIIFALTARKTIIDSLPQVFEKIFIINDEE